MNIILLIIFVAGVVMRACARFVCNAALYGVGSAFMIAGLVIYSVLAAFMLNIVIGAVGFFFTAITIISTKHELKRLRAAVLKAKEGQA